MEVRCPETVRDHILYRVQISPDGKAIEFLGEADTGPESLVLRLEMAPPGKPDVFSPVVSGGIRHKK